VRYYYEILDIGELLLPAKGPYQGPYLELLLSDSQDKPES
jgi:hypothetical protein